MRYISTRGKAPELTFEEATLAGLARDGGLYLPDTIPGMEAADIAALAGQSYEEAAFRVMRPFVGDGFTGDGFRDIVASAYSDFRHDARAPLKQIGPNHFLLELFHGPTLAFKDFAMRFIGQLFQAVLERRGERLTIVGATSGDTGSAAIDAFRGLAAVDVFILFPHGRVSEVQRRQITVHTERNVHALALRGDFDDCQARVKDMFNDLGFRDGVRLAAVNSINWGRILAQVVYYFTSAVALGAPHRAIDFTVPTGNFGDIFAGWIARRMGLPIGRLVIATNQNDILHRTLADGNHARLEVRPSVSPSMDIQVSSNFERALYFAHGRNSSAVVRDMEALTADGVFTVSQGALEALREMFSSGRADESETVTTIAAQYRATGEILCPHTAVGVKVAEEFLGPNPMVTLATAHPGKFPDTVESAVGMRPTLPPHMAGLYSRPERVTEVPNDLNVLEELIWRRIAK